MGLGNPATGQMKEQRPRSCTCILLSIYQTCDPSQGARTNSRPALPSGPYCPAHPRNAVPKVLVLQESLEPQELGGAEWRADSPKCWGREKSRR